jgi:hypothetical protein
MSVADPEYFKEPPTIVTIDDKYFLRFVYTDKGSFVYFMATQSRIKGDKLLFYIPATTSSGSKHGQVQFEEIRTDDKIRLIREKLAYWINPDGTTVTLRMGPLNEAEFDEWGKGKVIVKH